MTKARDLANIISGGFTEADIPNLPASKITSGTFADARIASSSVTQHASSYIDWQSVVTASTLNAVSGKGYPINTTSNTCTITMPSNPSVGDTIKFVDYARNFGTNKIIINPNSKKFQGNTSPNPEYNTTGQSITCTYIDVTQGWIPTVDDDVTMETPQSYAVDFLCIAGGGAASSISGPGGGGAGGYRSSYNNETSGGGGAAETALSLTPSTTYTITIGAGGAGTGSSSSVIGNAGNDSSISGSDITDIVSVGGGIGGFSSGNFDGGSGGGGRNGAGGSGTANQGHDGGTGVATAGGGGGGAGAVGANGASNTPGNGGNGVASTITGSSVTRGGGGGAGTYQGSLASGGSGGGGNGGNPAGVAGTANTGSGGGAGHHNCLGSGTGGKGIVAIRYKFQA